MLLILKTLSCNALLSFWNSDDPNFEENVLHKSVKCGKVFLSHKLRYYTSLSGPEKSRNNTRDKNIVFFLRVLI